MYGEFYTWCELLWSIQGSKSCDLWKTWTRIKTPVTEQKITRKSHSNIAPTVSKDNIDNGEGESIQILFKISCSKESYSKVHCHSGARQMLKYYIVPSLIDETSDRITLHGGCNDANNKNSTPERIANQLADMAILCRDYSVSDIFISAMICRRFKILNGKVKRVYFLLKHICE